MSTFDKDLSSLDEYYENERSTDDLEQELILAAANADARNHEHNSNPAEDASPPVENSPQHEYGNSSGSRLKRSLSPCDDDVSRATLLKTNDGEAVPRPSEGYGKIIATHYNTLEEKGLHERSKSRIFYLRNFHNWIKSMLINEYLTKIKDGKRHNSPIHVMDMGCGKGGDLLKWRKGGITHLICNDIADVSLDQCKSRYQDMTSRNGRDRNSSIYTVENIAADFTKIRLRKKYKDPSIKLDLVSCQFAFHYGFESLAQAECTMHNAAECLQPGGFFIGTILDSNDLISRVRKAGSNSFGNGIYKVEFECDVNKPPLFGGKYHFNLDGVVDCPEFLVHFPTLIKLAKKYGLKLVRSEKFYDFYERMHVEGQQLMGNMKGLETFPPYQNTSLVGTDADDYSHADEFLRNTFHNRNPNSKIGTLSKSEWEASCMYYLFMSLIFCTFLALYVTFAFEKVKNTWAADGTPIYQF